MQQLLPGTGSQMKRFKKILLWIASFILLAVVLCIGFVYYVLQNSLPESNPVFSQEIRERVTVTRDERGVAFIHAEDQISLFFAQGYVHADQRLWQMEFNRRVVQGRLAEILGQDLASTDRFLRTLGLERIAKQVMQKTSLQGQGIVQDYVRGVNARLQEGRLPPEMLVLRFEPEPWTEVDVAGVLALMAFDLGSNQQQESLRISLQETLSQELFSEITPVYENWETPAIWHREQARPARKSSSLSRDLPVLNRLTTISAFIPRLGSNSWVLSPEKWAGQTALLANDPHLGLGLPCIWFENSLEVHGEFRVYGWSIPGTPGVVIGHNENIAWGMTNIGDTQDLFLERQHPENPHMFRYEDQWYQARVLQEEIQIKGQEQPELLEVVITKNGPLIAEDPALSIQWTAYHVQNSTIDAVLKMNQAHNWEEFLSALEHFSLPVQNIVYADIEGNIGFKTAGMLPIRKKGQGLVPVPGWDADYGWSGFIDQDELPKLFNPPQGYVVTANHKVAGDDYPFLIGLDHGSPYRMMRIKEVLQSSSNLNLADMKSLQTDWYNMQAKTRLPLWLDLVQADMDRFPENYDQVQSQGLFLLQEWVKNPVSAPEQAAPAIYACWYLNLMQEAFRPKMGAALYQNFIEQGYVAYKALDYLLEKRGDSAWFADGLQQKLSASYKLSIDQLVDKLGPDPEKWQWQQLQTVSLEHVLGASRLLAPFVNRGPYPYGGDYETVGRAKYNLNNPFQVTGGPGLRFIAVLEPEIQAYAVLAGGQSGHFMADNYDDQLQTWLAGGYYQVGFTQQFKQ